MNETTRFLPNTKIFKPKPKELPGQRVKEVASFIKQNFTDDEIKKLIKILSVK